MNVGNLRAPSTTARTGSDKWKSTPRVIFSAVIAVCLSGYLLISTTWGVRWIDSWHDEQRALQVVLLCLVGPLILWQWAREPSSWLDKPPPSLLAVFLLGLVAALHSGLTTHALADVALYASLLVLAIGVRLATQRGAESVRIACQLALLLALAHAVGILTRYVAALQLQGPMDTMVLLLGYANPRFPSALYALLIPLVAALAVDRMGRRGLRHLADLILILLWCFNIALQTRALAFAYLLAVPAVLVVLGWRATSAMVIRLAVTAMFGALLYGLMFLGIPQWIGSGAAQASREGLLTGSGREALLMMGWESIRKAPLLGLGPMGFASIANKMGAHPHNWIVQLAVEWGVPAALLALVAALRGLRTASLRIRELISDGSPMATMAVGALLSVVVGLIYGLVDGNLVMPVSQIAFFAVVGILWGTTIPTVAAPVDWRPAIRAGRVTLRGIAAASIVYLAWYAVQTLPRQEARRAWHEKNRVPMPYLLPRFWEQGLIPPAEPPFPVTELRSAPQHRQRGRTGDSS